MLKTFCLYPSCDYGLRFYSPLLEVWVLDCNCPGVAFNWLLLKTMTHVLTRGLSQHAFKNSKHSTCWLSLDCQQQVFVIEQRQLSNKKKVLSIQIKVKLLWIYKFAIHISNQSNSSSPMSGFGKVLKLTLSARLVDVIFCICFMTSLSKVRQCVSNKSNLISSNEYYYSSAFFGVTR